MVAQMESPFHDLDAYLALSRSSGLVLSPDGSQLVTTVATLNAKRTQYRTALWRLDPSGDSPARRLTRSRKGESSAVFTDVGDILFTSARPDPEADEDEEGPAAMWLLPAEGGDARLIGNRLGGFEKIASHADVVLAGAQRLGSADLADEERIRKDRKDLNVSAILHSSYPVRHWDHDLGPGATHLLSGPLPDESASTAALDLTDLTPDAAPHQIADFDLAPDGSFAILTWVAIGANGERHSSLRRLDLADGSVRTVYDDPDGADAHEQLGSDFAVGVAGGDEGGDLLLGRGQVPARGGASADPSELGPGLLRPEAGADTVERGERPLERLSRGCFLLCPALGHAQGQERARELERPRDTLMLLDCLFERGQRAGNVAS